MEVSRTELTVAVNFFEAGHGKNEVDSLFGVLAQLLKRDLPQLGLTSLSDLVSFFRLNTLNLDMRKPDNLKQHFIVEYDKSYEFQDPCHLIIKEVKSCLRYEVRNGLLYGSETSAESAQSVIKLWKKRPPTQLVTAQNACLSTVTTVPSSGYTDTLVLESIETTHNDRHIISRSSLPFPPSSNCISFPLALQHTIEDELHSLTIAQMKNLPCTSFVAWLMPALRHSITFLNPLQRCIERKMVFIDSAL
ncbi:hypothetical protein BLNAU_4194 [Blattamonas nauphoetae]|uniref:Uncharacterized protein n=1 Tax=Blattamonas nauphoetae TaxID=2049346 RepID=A0ABQ9YAI9_9EUKA|nr:hypothetical protein BLNAU_4194 [Blattamonas nauphoetae]